MWDFFWPHDFIVKKSCGEFFYYRSIILLIVFKIPEIKRFHSEQMSLNDIALFLFGAENSGAGPDELWGRAVVRNTRHPKKLICLNLESGCFTD